MKVTTHMICGIFFFYIKVCMEVYNSKKLEYRHIFLIGYQRMFLSDEIMSVRSTHANYAASSQLSLSLNVSEFYSTVIQMECNGVGT